MSDRAESRAEAEDYDRYCEQYGGWRERGRARPHTGSLLPSVRKGRQKKEERRTYDGRTQTQERTYERKQDR